MNTEDEDIKDPLPPTMQRVAHRALVMAVVSCRGYIEGNPAQTSNAGDLARRAHEWLRSLGLADELTAWERQVLQTPLGNLSERDRINATWLSEAVTVLAWALGKNNLPSYEEQCDPAGAANSLGFLQPLEDTVLEEADLKTEEQLREYNEFIYNLHWRLRDFSLNGRPYNFRSLAMKAWGKPLLRHGLVLVGDDLAISGVPIAEVPEREWRTVLSITRERHRASNWLIGYASEDFYEVTTDT